MRFEKVSYEAFKHDMLKYGWGEKNIQEAYDNIKIPERKTMYSAGYDFATPCSFEIEPQQNIVIPTGVKCYFPERKAEKYHLEMFVRSSVGIKKGVVLSNGTAIIDGDFYNSGEGEGGMLIALHNSSDMKRSFNTGDRVVQGVFVRHSVVEGDVTTGIRRGGVGSTDRKEKTIEEYIEDSVDIEGYGGKYKVTRDGHVISMWRMIIINGDVRRIDKPIILKASPYKTGYCFVNLCNGYGNPRAVGVHRLVAKAFIPNPDNKRNVCHKDNNPMNNSVDNLYWGTNQENVYQCVRDGLHGLEQKVMQLDMEGNIIAIYQSVTEAGKTTGIERKNITRVLCGHRKKAGGYAWKRADDEDWEAWDTRNGGKPEKYDRRGWHKNSEYICCDDGTSIPEYHITFDTTNIEIAERIQDFFESIMEDNEAVNRNALAGGVGSSGK